MYILVERNLDNKPQVYDHRIYSSLDEIKTVLSDRLKPGGDDWYPPNINSLYIYRLSYIGQYRIKTELLFDPS